MVCFCIVSMHLRVILINLPDSFRNLLSLILSLFVFCSENLIVPVVIDLLDCHIRFISLYSLHFVTPSEKLVLCLCHLWNQLIQSVCA